MNTKLLFLASLSALFLAPPGARAEEASPAVAALEASGFKAHGMSGGGYAIDYTEVKEFDDATFSQFESLGNVREMSGDGAAINDETLARLAKLPNLERFFVNASSVTDKGLEALAAAPKLQHLGIHHGPAEMKGKGLLAFKNRANFSSVEFGGMTSIDDESVSYLAELPHLRAINIYHTLNTRASLPLLVKKNPLLEKFALNPHFDPKRFSAEDIALLAPLKNLGQLSLNDMVLPYENGLSHLTTLKGLKKVSIEWSIYTDEDLAKLKAALPGVEIISTNRAKEENLAIWNERVAEMKKEATIMA